MKSSEIFTHHFNKAVKITFKNGNTLHGIFIDHNVDANDLTNWDFVENKNAIEYKKSEDSNLVTIITNEEILNVENV
jgi:hypothetical protein